MFMPNTTKASRHSSIGAAGKQNNTACSEAGDRPAGTKLRDNSVPVTSKFNGNNAIETRHRLFNRNINKHIELETRDNI
jgi:hypothetical protein